MVKMYRTQVYDSKGKKDWVTISSYRNGTPKRKLKKRKAPERRSSGGLGWDNPFY